MLINCLLFVCQFLRASFSHWILMCRNFLKVAYMYLTYDLLFCNPNSLFLNSLLNVITSLIYFPGLTILQTTCGNASHYGVFSNKGSIPKGTRYGPFQGKLVNTSEIKTHDDNTLMWEVSYLYSPPCENSS